MEGRETKGVGKYEKVKGRITFEPPPLSFKGLSSSQKTLEGRLGHWPAEGPHGSLHLPIVTYTVRTHR